MADFFLARKFPFIIAFDIKIPSYKSGQMMLMVIIFQMQAKIR